MCHNLHRFRPLKQSHLYVPLSAYDVMTALRASCFPSTSLAIREIDFASGTVSLDMEEIPIPG